MPTHITQVHQKGIKAVNTRKTYTAVGQRKKSNIRASKKSVTAMSASKASTTNIGYESENPMARIANNNFLGSGARMSGGGYQT